MTKDTIYREDAIKAISLRARIPHDVASAHYASMAINAIRSVPSADRPKGGLKIWLADRKTEPQTCSVNGRPYTDCCNCEHFKCTADELQTERPCDNCQEWDCYGCDYKQTERSK